MKGYWDREKDTKNAFTEDGWLKTGDQGAYDGEGRLKIVGRIKEIIVTSTGEKISPVDIESALETIPLFRQTYAVGDGMPYIAVLISLDPTFGKNLLQSRVLIRRIRNLFMPLPCAKRRWKWSRKRAAHSRPTLYPKTLRSLWMSGRLITDCLLPP